MKMYKIKNKKWMRRGILAASSFVLGYGVCTFLTPDYGAMMRPNMTPYVSVRMPVAQDLSQKAKFIAQAEAVNSVDIIPQVAGYLEEVKFKDGSFVNAGDVLFVIEQKKFQANVALATADLEKAQSDLKQIQNDYRRKKQLFQEKFISKSELESVENKFSQAQSTIRQAEANLELANINLGYSEIKAPISGYIGKAFVSKGNYVHPSVQPLARIVQTDPIRIAFSVSDKERLAFLSHVKNGTQAVSFEIVYPTGDKEPVTINQIFAGNEINAQTATIPVYIDYQNPDRKLLPGTFVDILVRAAQADAVLTVPVTALAQDSNGTYVMVVTPDNRAEQKYVQIGQAAGLFQEVTHGLTAMDRVIVQGLQKVSSGMTVNPVMIQEQTQD